MPVYEYVALTADGRKNKGSVEADNVRTARQKLRTQGVYATDIREGIELAQQSKTKDVRRYFQSDRVNLKTLAISTRQLATLVGAGLPLVNSLAALGDQTDSLTMKRIIIDVKEKVEEGLTLAKALGNFPKSFPSLYINMVASGEASGTLDTVLANLAEYLEAQIELRRKVSTALIYPVLMLIICSLVVIALLTFVVPRIVEIFQKQNAVLPLPTRVMIFISDSLVFYWPLFIVLVLGIIIGAKSYYGQPKGRAVIDRLMLKLPIYGPLFIKVSTARVARTLSALLSSGVGLLVGLEVTRNIVSNVHIREALDSAREGVREGRSLAKELSKSGIFPNMLSHMIAVGEQSGELETMLGKAGKAYENDVNTSLSGLTALIEPLMMIGVGGIVFAIIISVLLPMADLITAIQQ